MPRTSSVLPRDLLVQVKAITEQPGGNAKLLKRSSLAPMSLKRARDGEVVSQSTIERISKAVEYVNRSIDVPTVAATATAALEPIQIVEQYDAVTEAAKAFVQFFNNDANKLLGTGQAREAFSRLQDAVQMVALFQGRGDAPACSFAVKAPINDYFD